MDDSITEKELKDRALLVLKNAKFCHLGMSMDNMPYVVTVNFGYDMDYLYFHSSQKGRKNATIASNSNVCFELNYGGEIYSNKNACNWGTKFRSLIGEGVAERIDDEGQKILALKAIMKKYSGTSEHEFNNQVMTHTNVYRVSLKNISVKQNRMYWGK